jgi:FkbM family methyltransferase
MGNPLAKRLIAGFVRGLPPRVRKALLRELCNRAAAREGYEAFQLLGRRFGIADLRVPGDCGVIEGALADTAILATYAQTRRWSASLNHVVDAFFETRDSGTYIDIGANIGLTTIPIARHAAISCKAFEPEPQTFRYLTTNLRHNCTAGNVEPFNLALSDRHGTIAFELADDNLGDNRIHLTDDEGSFGEAKRRVITVPTDRLDDVLGVAHLARPIAVKIDTQGAECRVLDGGRSVLDAASIITFEFWPYGMRRMASDPASLISFIATRFSDGALVNGDANEMPVWQPIDDVVGRLGAFTHESRDKPYATCDVIVRK